MLRLLITDGTNKNSLAILRNLSPKKYTIDVVSSIPEKYSLCGYSKFTNEFFRIKSNPNNIDEYAKDLIDTLRKNDYDVFIPVGLESNIAASKYKAEICSTTHSLIPDWNSMDIAANKDQTMEHAKKIGIPIPDTIWLEDMSSLENVVCFPCVIKSSDGSRDYVRYCNSKKDLYSNYEYLQARSKTKVICQNYIRGFGCGFFGVYKDGKPIVHFLHRRLKEFPITGGPSAVAESFFDDRLLSEGLKICNSLNWNGPIMAEFKYSIEDNQYKLIELNPKLWGSMDLTIQAGIDIPETLVRLSMGQPLEFNATYKYVKYRWILPDEMKVLASQPTLKNLRDFFKTDHNTVTNIRFNDPMPTMFQLGRGIFESFKLLVNKNLRFSHGEQEPLNYDQYDHMELSHRSKSKSS